VAATPGAQDGPVLDAWLDLVHGGGCVGCARPGRALCRGCALLVPTVGGAARPTPCPPGLAACFAAGEYAGLLGAMVVAHKERSAFSLAAPLGRALAAAATVAAGPPDGGATLVLVPVPSRPSVVRARGHDPLLRVVRETARILRRRGHAVAVHRLLEQHAAVRDQAGLGSDQRAANLRGSMRVHPPARAALARRGAPVSLVVCDDVLTTGATAREAQRALEEAGLRVRAVATVAATRRQRASHADGGVGPISFFDRRLPSGHGVQPGP
jgi:predicted amidophosphoribosyltransferase